MKTILRSIFLSILFITLSFANIINVPADQPTIQTGIDAATIGDTVLVEDSTYYENINFKGKAIMVASHFLVDGDSTHIDSTIIDGSQPTNTDSGSVVYFISGEDTNSVLCGFTITGGTGTLIPSIPPMQPFPFRIGGGISCSMSGAHIINNIINGNECIINLAEGNTGGGGIAAYPPGHNSYIIIEMNEIRDNLAWTQGNPTAWFNAFGQGGGIAVFTNGLIKENEIYSNQCKSENGYSCGGGIRVMGGTVKILNNDIHQNSSVSTNSIGFAGGISCSAANATIESNRISNNFIAGSSECFGNAIYFDLQNDTYWAVVKGNNIFGNYHTNGICYGGAIGMYTSSTEIYKNIFYNNSADYGGALHAYNNSKPKIVNNTVTGNTASNAGGALYAEDNTTNVLLMNSILFNNIASVTSNEIDVQSGSTISVLYCDIQGGFSGTGNMNSDPLFSDTLYHLGLGSPCIDTGDPSPTCNDSDGSRNDMGAYGGISDSLMYHITGIHKKENEFHFPQEYALLKNYPNPFNPSTKIEFDLPKSSDVRIEVYSITGQKVQTLLNEKRSAGNHQVEFNAQNLSSGVYFYRIEAEEFQDVKKMVLLR